MSTSFFGKYIVPEAATLRNTDSYRTIPPIDDGAAREVLYGGTRLLNLASNNYLGLSSHPELIEAATKAATRHGCSSGASRLITGNFALAETLEAELATFKHQEAALVTSSGYAANLAVFTALADRHTVVFSDRLNHASIIDGVLLSGARLVRYRHLDMGHLERLLAREALVDKKIIVTDSVFSMDGDVAPLARLVELGKAHGALIVVDEAHAMGVLGRGRGLTAALGLSEDVDVHVGTLSKALGSLGGYVAGRVETIELLRNRGRSFIFSTALPPAVLGASLAALRHIKSNPGLGARLMRLSKQIRDHLIGLGFDTMGSTTQIIPVSCGRNRVALHAQALLRAEGLLVAAVRPPTVPQGTARLRLSLRADLTDDDLKRIRLGFSRLRVTFFP
ncbi:8-amino-7-oxononanoate synthase [Desulfovibrio aerotolerans]|uniref:8-amino-7-ketopelargonate synthase n=1 Tax=Solidesulfovibrio aerotolerans TaxID=295255 RepID=A0A7C9MMC0_9BACT|nr:8-amino-7-oxononanoate synthase [Solidesulfovibrio aerotolerans]MYL84453.1 8-amino-7-oxononanoate synthase [Solidesulfovibrio aerotolerans]